MGAKENRQKMKRKQALWDQQSGLCYWCSKPMLHWPEGGYKAKKGDPLPKNLATIEHLRDRWHPGRREPANGDKRWALACWRCNNIRGKQSQNSQPLELRWAKSQRAPSSADRATEF